jgi:hypothetical protein
LLAACWLLATAVLQSRARPAPLQSAYLSSRTLLSPPLPLAVSPATFFRNGTTPRPDKTASRSSLNLAERATHHPPSATPPQQLSGAAYLFSGSALEPPALPVFQSRCAPPKQWRLLLPLTANSSGPSRPNLPQTQRLFQRPKPQLHGFIPTSVPLYRILSKKPWLLPAPMQPMLARAIPKPMWLNLSSPFPLRNSYAPETR